MALSLSNSIKIRTYVAVQFSTSRHTEMQYVILPKQKHGDWSPGVHPGPTFDSQGFESAKWYRCDGAPWRFEIESEVRYEFLRGQCCLI